MKLYVWETHKDYEGMLTFAIADSEEDAKKLIIQEIGFPGIYKYPDVLPDFMDEYCSVYDLNEPIAFYMSHSG